MRSLKLLLAIGLTSMTTACGSFNFNEMLAGKDEKESFDRLVQEAQYEYDKGRYDNALRLSDKALALNPNSEAPTILKSYVYLSKAGLDAINISRTLIVANEKDKTAVPAASDPAKTGDTTADNFNTLKTVLNLSETDYTAMSSGVENIGSPALPVYLPLSAGNARLGNSESLAYMNDAVETLCPLILENANPEDDKDTRHDCAKNAFAGAQKGRANFGWALAHLGEAITFYSVILYDSTGTGIPNLQAAIPKGELTAANASSFITTVNGLNKALNAIFPTDPIESAASMLNGLFGDLKTASTALSAIPGVPTEVSDSVQKSIKDLDAKIAAITATSAATTEASAQNEALKNSLTKGLATTMESKIESSEFTNLPQNDQDKACCVYRSMNATAARPTTCSALIYTDASCAVLLAQ
jgi:tetratricopeptide (TPR) repeat protein